MYTLWTGSLGKLLCRKPPCPEGEIHYSCTKTPSPVPIPCHFLGVLMEMVYFILSVHKWPIQSQTLANQALNHIKF